MKNYAVIEDGIVVNVVIADDEWVAEQTTELVEYSDENPAFIGGDYVDGLFYRPQPYPSWVRFEGIWTPPVPMPDTVADGHAWMWNEDVVDWEEIEIPSVIAPADTTDGGDDSGD
jgi:hypothetical protein